MAVKPTTPALDTGHELYSGLVACWPFDEGSGLTVADLLGSLDATITAGGDAHWGSDAEVGDYWEATSADYARVAGNADFEAIDTAFSISLLIKAPASYADADRICWFRNDSGVETNKGVAFLVSNASPNGEVWASSRSDDLGGTSIQVYEGEVDALDGDWHRVVYTWDGSDITLYVDGVETASGSMAGSWLNSGNDLIFGSDGAGSDQLDGLLIADGRTWNRALSAGEVSREAADPWALYGESAASYTPDLDDSGFTDLGTAAQAVYVSSSTGDNGNDGLSTGAPKETLAAGYAVLRDGYADHLLLKRGDTWTDERFTSWGKSGASSSGKMVIGAYGTGDRPVVTSPSGNWWYNNAGVEHLAITSLKIQGSSGEYAGINSLVAMNDVLLEDLEITGFNDGIVLQGEYTGAGGLTRHQDCTVRRCVIYDNYTGTTGHSQGIFAKACDGLVIEENYFDRNGWITDRDTEATIYNHNAYLQYDNGDIIFRNNWSSRASSHAVQQRAGGWQDDNTYYKNPISGAIGWNTNESPHTSGFKCYLRRNVTVDSDDITSSLPRGIGHGISNASEGDIADNLVIHVGTDATGTHLGIGGASNDLQWTAKFRRNTVYKWNQGIGFSGSGYTSFELTDNDVQVCNDEVYESDAGCDADSAAAPGSNQFYSTLAAGARYKTAGTFETNFAGWQSTTGDSTSAETEVSYTDPDKDMDDYAVSIGLADADAMLTQIRTQRKGNWDLNLTPDRINAWFRANFDKIPVPSGFTAAKDGVDVDLEWDAIPGADSYIIERRTDGGSWEQIGTV